MKIDEGLAKEEEKYESGKELGRVVGGKYDRNTL